MLSSLPSEEYDAPHFLLSPQHQHLNNCISITYVLNYPGLDLIDKVPDELWTEVHDIVQETGIKTIPMGKKMQKRKMAV